MVMQGKDGFRDNRAVGRVEEKIRERCKEEANMWERCLLRTQCLLHESYVGAHLQLPSLIRRGANMADSAELTAALAAIEASGKSLPQAYPSPTELDLFTSAFRIRFRKEEHERKVRTLPPWNPQTLNAAVQPWFTTEPASEGCATTAPPCG